MATKRSRAASPCRRVYSLGFVEGIGLTLLSVLLLTKTGTVHPSGAQAIHPQPIMELALADSEQKSLTDMVKCE